MYGVRQREPVRLPPAVAGGADLSPLSLEPRLHAHRGAADPAGVGLRKDLGRDRRRQGRRGRLPARSEAGSRADVELNVRKAYFGLKLAREVLDTLDEGGGYIDDAQKKIEKDLAKGSGQLDGDRQAAHADGARRHRRRAFSRPSDCRASRVNSLRALHRAGLARRHRRRRRYVRAARRHRPAGHLLRRSGAVGATRGEDCSITRSRPSTRWPISSAARNIRTSFSSAARSFARAQGVDNPTNAFFSHYFNSTAAGSRRRCACRSTSGPGSRAAGGWRAEADADRLSAERGAERHHARGAQGLRRGQRGAAARRRAWRRGRRRARRGSRRWRRTSRSGWPRRATSRTR